MSKIALRIEKYSSSQLKELIHKNVKFQQGVRLYACYQVSKGKTPKELEDVYDTTFKSICNWINRLNEGGVEGLVDKVKPGRTSKLTDAQQGIIKKMLLTESPEKYNYNSSTWTGLLLIDWIKTHYYIEYKKAQIYNILKKMNLSFQKGKGFYPETVQRDNHVEALKKTPRRKRTK